MPASDDVLVATPEHRFTFGLWTVGNPGRDPFGGPTRDAGRSRRLRPQAGRARRVGRLAARRRPRPVGQLGGRARPIVARFKAALQSTGLGVGMATTNLFGAPGLQGRRVHVQRPRACAARRSARRCARSTSAPSWAPRCTSSGAGARAPRRASPRTRATRSSATARRSTCSATTSSRAGLRPALRDRAQAQRAARGHLPADGRPRAALHLDAPAARHGRRQPRGRARDDGRAVVPPRRRAGAVGRQALPHRPQRRSASAATTRTSASAPRTSRRRSCSCGCSSARATPGRAHFDAHAYRNENAEGVWDFARGLHAHLPRAGRAAPRASTRCPRSRRRWPPPRSPSSREPSVERRARPTR